MSRSQEPVFSVGDLVTFRTGKNSSLKLTVTKITPRTKPNYMGRQYIYNFELVCVTDRGTHFKEMQNMFRAYVPQSVSSQPATNLSQISAGSTQGQTSSGNLVAALLSQQSSAPPSIRVRSYL